MHRSSLLLHRNGDFEVLSLLCQTAQAGGTDGPDVEPALLNLLLERLLPLAKPTSHAMLIAVHNLMDLLYEFKTFPVALYFAADSQAGWDEVACACELLEAVLLLQDHISTDLLEHVVVSKDVSNLKPADSVVQRAWSLSAELSGSVYVVPEKEIYLRRLEVIPDCQDCNLEDYVAYFGKSQ